MNTSNLKKVAPKARIAFINAITARAAEFGITAQGCTEPVISGEVLQVGSFTHPAKWAPSLQRLRQKVAELGFAQLMEQMAYTWFNRFCAIRFMELKSDDSYLEHGVRLLSHPTQPLGFEALDRAPEVIDSLLEEKVPLDKPALLDLLLAGNEQEALLRELLLGQCHRLHQAMPFLFEAIDDETELLLPGGLTRTDAFWRPLVDEIPEADWQQVEVIGWLYQFYISDKKDEVIGKVVKSEDIPAATQLFTPNWIVQYLVQNSVGRYWMQTYPDSALPQSMPYYVAPGEQAPEVLAALARQTPESIEPESITVLDPACGSGHILVEAYNLLYRIYEERGYRSREIPELILTHNLFGLDIDDRAAQLAGFALLMRARQDDRRLFTRDISLNIHALHETRHLEIAKLWQALNLNADWRRGEIQDLFAGEPAGLDSKDPRYALLRDLTKRFIQAKTFGSLIEVPAEQAPALDELAADLRRLLADGQGKGDAMQRAAADTLLPYIEQARLLARRYDAVIANPPYMGGKGMNVELKEFAKKYFTNSKSDLFAMFMERAFRVIRPHGFNAQVNMQGWMYLSSFEELRKGVINDFCFLGLAHLGAKAFPEIAGEIVQTAAWIMTHKIPSYRGAFFRLTDADGEGKRTFLLEGKNRFDVCAEDSFTSIPGWPISYWLNNDIVNVFNKNQRLGDVAKAKIGLLTSDNDRFLRYHWEVSVLNSCFNAKNDQDAISSGAKWFPHNKGGNARRWCGNKDYLVNWKNCGEEIKNTVLRKYPYLNGNPQFVVHDDGFYFRPSISWSETGSGVPSFRYYSEGFTFNVGGVSAFPLNEVDTCKILAFCNSSYVATVYWALNPTMHFGANNFCSLPAALDFDDEVESRVKRLVQLASDDWDSAETSWGFLTNSLILVGCESTEESYRILSMKHQDIIDEVRILEEKNNEVLVSRYGLHESIDYRVSDEKITLHCNVSFRYKCSEKNNMGLDCKQSDIVVDFLSYAIGCMMGRYSLDREGLVYAHAGNVGFKELVAEGAYASFAADDDGILPLTSEHWFADDVA